MTRQPREEYEFQRLVVNSTANAAQNHHDVQPPHPSGLLLDHLASDVTCRAEIEGYSWQIFTWPEPERAQAVAPGSRDFTPRISGLRLSTIIVLEEYTSAFLHVVHLLYSGVIDRRITV